MNLKSFLKTTVFAAKPALSQCETVLLQYVYSFKVYSTEKSIYNLLHRPPIYMSVHSQRPGFFRAKCIYIYIKSKLQQFIPHKLESASESFKPPRTRLWWSSSPSSHPDGEHGTFPQTHCKRDSNFGYSFLFLF